MQSYSLLLPPLLKIVQQAGELLTQFYEQSVKIYTKSDNTPVTEADLAVNQFLTAQLSSLTPDVPILSEENCDIPFHDRRQWQRYWLIDPLDGTQQFIDRTGQFGILIALMEQNRPVLGVIHAPILQTTYYASLGGGAFKLTAQGLTALPKRQFDLTKPIKILLGSSNNEQKVRGILRQDFCYQFETYGSSGLKSALVAEGKADCYIRLGKTGEWDTAAAEILLAETGCHLRDTQFNPLTYNQRETLINPHFVICAGDEQDWRKIFQFNSY